MAIGSMGFGQLGNGGIIFKRKFRWGLTLQVCGYTLEEEFVKAAARPKMTIDETEVNIKNGKMFIPGKAYWDQMTCTFYDVVDQENEGMGSAQILYSWLTTIYDFRAEGEGNLKMASSKRVEDTGYAGRITLRLYTGGGKTLETWEIGDAFPVSVDFGGLEYNSSDEVNIETSLRFHDVNYTAYCGGQPSPCQDPGCGASEGLLE